MFQQGAVSQVFSFFFFSSRRRHTRSCLVSWARRCVQETGYQRRVHGRVLKPNYKLQESMLAFSESALQDADVLLYVTDVVETPDKNIDFLNEVAKMTIPVLLLINKIDQTNQQNLGEIVEKWHTLLPNAEILPISAQNKFGTDMLMKRINELLPDSPPYFDKNQLTDKPARFFVSEIIREKILLYYDKEIPYSVEVAVEQFKEDNTHIHINAVIYVERDSQKGIIIGHQGIALKKVSTESRKTLERFFGKSVYLETFVKVDKDWRSSDRELHNFGYQSEQQKTYGKFSSNRRQTQCRQIDIIQQTNKDTSRYSK
eukprot:TRINITY_DN24369_c0_g1_i1.p1 TRINITY_DN24369_c0_g1~~TRINITY_DN24369_c0_g1_i1.p1  ORF type:complete len:315 (+),score=17.51 TRINITY_DN24369_c0_g1_i1:34-978(+)